MSRGPNKSPEPTAVGAVSSAVGGGSALDRYKFKVIAYWTTTALVALIMTVSGGMATLHAPPMMKALSHLGYPPYFANLLGVGKLTGVCVFLLPGLLKLKEWVYAGFGITLIGAAYSHWQSGDGFMALDPLFFFTMLVISYLTRPAGRR
jgi:hypothetical protein